MSHQVSVPDVAVAAATDQYRAAYSDAWSYSPLEPLYASLEAAQKRCESALRGACEDGESLVITWRPNSDSPTLWDMLVQTPLLRTPVRVGYMVTVAGSDFDAPAAETTETPSPG